VAGVQEILPGVFHWTARHPTIGIEVSSYCLADVRVLIDPLLPPEGLDWIADHGPPTDVLLTNRHHWRHCSELIEAFGVTVHASRPGMHEFGPDRPVTPFDFGDELPGRAVAHEVGAICPDESALHFPGEAMLACADGVIRDGDGPLTFVPDGYMDDPQETKAGLATAYRRLLDLDFDTLLLAHGNPWVGGARGALQEFAA